MEKLINGRKVQLRFVGGSIIASTPGKKDAFFEIADTQTDQNTLAAHVVTQLRKKWK